MERLVADLHHPPDFARPWRERAVRATHAAILALILAGFLPNEVCVGVMFASGLDEGSEILVGPRGGRDRYPCRRSPN